MACCEASAWTEESQPASSSNQRSRLDLIEARPGPSADEAVGWARRFVARDGSGTIALVVDEFGFYQND